MIRLMRLKHQNERVSFARLSRSCGNVGLRSFTVWTVKDKQDSSLVSNQTLDLDVLVAKQDIRIEDPATQAGSEAPMKKQRFGLTFRHVAAILFTLLLAQGSLLLAQQPPPPPPPGS